MRDLFAAFARRGLPRFRRSLLAMILGGVASAVCAEPERVVTVSPTPRQRMVYGMDFERLWFWDAVSNKTRLAEVAVKECRVDYVRVAISGGAELVEGTFDPNAYTQILDCMRTLKAARPDLQFFAIPQPIHVVVKGAPYACFPSWIMVHNDKGKFQKFHWDKAADYLVRYLRFMKEQGFTIAFLDTKNENDKKVRPDEAARMVARMREQMGAELPRIVSPSSYDYQSGSDWLVEAKAGPGLDFIDVAATHNTKERGSLEGFVKLAEANGKTVWNTEMHGWAGPDALAVSNTVVLLTQIRAGVAGFNDWLSLGNQKKEHKMLRAMDDGSLEVMRIYHIYQQLVNTSGGGHSLPTSVPEGLTSSAAFLKGDLMTVWLLNNSHVPVAGVAIRLEGHQVVAGHATKVWWDADNGREGSRAAVAPVAPDRFMADVGVQTLVCFEFTVAPK